MSYRRRRAPNSALAAAATSSSGVRGPNSALTEFLRDHGINDELIQRRQMTLNAPEEDEEQDEEQVNGEAGEEGFEESLQRLARSNGRRRSRRGQARVAEGEEEDDEDLQIRIAARRKRRMAKKNESDYTDSEGEIDGPESDEDSSNKKQKKKILGPGQETNCYECKNLFKIVTFSRKVKGEDGNIIGYLCRDCTKIALEKDQAKRQKELQARKKRRKVAEALLDKEELKFPLLQDLCIKLVIKYIDQIEAFGDIGSTNLNKISRILCKNRLLTDTTLPLFLSPDIKHLKLWDCSKLSVTSLKTIASYCPNVRSLELTFPGKLNNGVFDYYISQFNDLESIDLNGAFLITDAMWEKFFRKFGSQLKTFVIRNSYRFTDKSLLSLIELCPNLEKLAISRLDGVLTKESIVRIAELSNLRHLEISHPVNENIVPDEIIIEILGNVGSRLETLVLDECTALTDGFLIDGIRPFCPELKKLSLEHLDQITDVGISGLFDNWDINSGIMSLNLHRCVLIGTNSLIDIINHSANSLIELNINSLSNVDRTFFEVASSKRLPLLTTLDCGFVRAVDNKVVYMLGEACPKLKVMEVYGNNRCSEAAKIRKGLQVIGRQSDSI